MYMQVSGYLWYFVCCIDMKYIQIAVIYTLSVSRVSQLNIDKNLILTLAISGPVSPLPGYYTQTDRLPNSSSWFSNSAHM